MRRVRLIDQNRATYLRATGGFESTCCTVEVSTWRLLADGPACTELLLLKLDDDDGNCGADSDILLLRPSGDGVISPSCLARSAGGVRLRCLENVLEQSSAASSAKGSMGENEWSSRRGARIGWTLWIWDDGCVTLFQGSDCRTIVVNRPYLLPFCGSAAGTASRR